MLGHSPLPAALLFFIFFSTLTVYSLNRLPLFIGKIPEPLSEKASWTLAHKKIFFSIFLVSVAGAFIPLFFLDTKILTFLAFAVLIVIPYPFSFPFRKPLREIPYIKIFLISLSWALITSTLPAIYAGHAFFEPVTVKLFVSRFLLIFAITVPFDIRDMGRDRMSGIQTLPLALGAGKSKSLALCALAAAAYIEWNLLPVKQAAALTAASAVAAFLILISSERRNELFFLGLVDGVMVLRFLLLLLVALN